MMMSRSLLRAAAVAFIALAPGACTPAAKAPETCATTGINRVGGPISLVDQTGKAVTQSDFIGQPTLLYFGFANCPDICPTSLQTLRAAMDSRAADAPAVRTVLVSLDPERDTPEVLARYVSSDAFPKGLIGLGGSVEQIDAAASAFKVLHQKREEPDSAVGYVIDHSSLFYLMGPDWRPKAIFPSSMPPADMAACIDAGLAGKTP
ncbi:MAG: electron transporter SCO1/SenC [Alphaproteobacteria bacterium]|nr:MAG: electron transporter SCO1/SenC [Caulobacteraceae bacterium]TPW04405.1 MAG: electron transporter SCO1/SenC [Alphaproteobacteria bacterium]